MSKTSFLVLSGRTPSFSVTRVLAQVLSTLLGDDRVVALACTPGENTPAFIGDVLLYFACLDQKEAALAHDSMLVVCPYMSNIPGFPELSVLLAAMVAHTQNLDAYIIHSRSAPFVEETDECRVPTTTSVVRSLKLLTRPSPREAKPPVIPGPTNWTDFRSVVQHWICSSKLGGLGLADMVQFPNDFDRLLADFNRWDAHSRQRRRWRAFYAVAYWLAEWKGTVPSIAGASPTAADWMKWVFLLQSLHVGAIRDARGMYTSNSKALNMCVTWFK